MPLHLVKLCVGVTAMDELEQWIIDCRDGQETLDHTTRMFPRRQEELRGGSLYWVIRGLILCRQPISAFTPVRGKDGIERCRIDFKPAIIPVRPVPRRPFQGWRYLEPTDAPPDLSSGASSKGLTDKMRRELADLGLL